MIKNILKRIKQFFRKKEKYISFHEGLKKAKEIFKDEYSFMEYPISEEIFFCGKIIEYILREKYSTTPPLYLYEPDIFNIPSYALRQRYPIEPIYDFFKNFKDGNTFFKKEEFDKFLKNYSLENYYPVTIENSYPDETDDLPEIKIEDAFEDIDNAPRRFKIKYANYGVDLIVDIY